MVKTVKKNETAAVDTVDTGMGRVFSQEQLRGIQTFADAAILLQEHFGTVVDATEEIGDGFKLFEKASLVKQDFIILDYTFRPGEYGGEFVVVRFITRGLNDELVKGVFIDGGSGVCRQLSEYHDATGRRGGIKVIGGLRESTYTYVDERDGSEKPGTTYYLSV